jgi:hypothetical protein
VDLVFTLVQYYYKAHTMLDLKGGANVGF